MNSISHIETRPFNYSEGETTVYPSQSPLMPTSPRFMIHTWLENVLVASNGHSAESVEELKKLGQEAHRFSIVKHSNCTKEIRAVIEACEKDPNPSAIQRLARQALNSFNQTSNSPRGRASSNPFELDKTPISE